MTRLKLGVLFGVLVAFGGVNATVVPAHAAVAPTLSVASSVDADHVTGGIGCPYSGIDEFHNGKVTLRLRAAQTRPVAVAYTLSGDTTAWRVRPASGATIPAGKTNLTLTFHPKTDSPQPVTVTINAGIGYTVGTPSNATVALMLAISDPPPCPERGVSTWPHRIAGGISTSTGNGFMVAFRDGVLNGDGNFPVHGDAATLPLPAPIAGISIAAHDRGYWLAASDGSVLAFGHARFSGSMNGTHLNQPVVSMSSTKTGNGYWLGASDGGVFSFGNAHFYGSAANLALSQPIVGITTLTSGAGYRLVARDGGIFDFGTARFHGSLPRRGIHVTDVVGMAATPSNQGYWIARSNGEVYGFGNAHTFRSYEASSSDPVAAIFRNPHAQGYRLVTRSGATIPFGNAPSGNQRTATPVQSPSPFTS